MFSPSHPPRLLAALTAALAALVGTASVAGQVLLTFEDAAARTAMQAFTFAGARQAHPGRWEIRGTDAMRHLVHVGDPTVTMRGISVAAVNAEAPLDIEVTARLRLIDGDRAGGVIWRYVDSDNFYFMTLVLSESTVSLFRVTGGNRILLDRVRNINVDADVWHTMTVVHQGDQIRGSINGIAIVHARDGIITGGRHAGVWSGGNSTTWFDDIGFHRVWR